MFLACASSRLLHVYYVVLTHTITNQCMEGSKIPTGADITILTPPTQQTK